MHPRGLFVWSRAASLTLCPLRPTPRVGVRSWHWSAVWGADALSRVLAPLAARLPAAVVALQHLDPRYATTLPQRLGAATALQVRVAVDGNQLQPGVVDVAPPGRHLLLGPGDRLLLVDSLDRPSPRPSADLLLVSMGAVLGDRLLAVVLTGTGDDGAVGVQVVSR
jgi:two-component system chemotaxis response regulator CheB